MDRTQIPFHPPLGLAVAADLCARSVGNDVQQTALLTSASQAQSSAGFDFRSWLCRGGMTGHRYRPGIEPDPGLGRSLPATAYRVKPDGLWLYHRAVPSVKILQ